MKKRIMALAICFVLVAVFLPISANAYTNHSQAEAVQWIKDRGNESWWDDVDKTAGCQCVDLVKAYYQYLVGYQVKSNAYEYWNNALPSGWYRDYTPTPGCIVCWKAYSDTGSGWSTGQYGHVGLVYKVSGSDVYTVETNVWTNGHSGEKGYSNAKFCVRHPKNAIYIHPDFNGSTPPPSITYTNIEEGIYYLRNVSNGKYLQVSYGTDANKQNVDTYDFILNGKNNLMSITKSNNGYKIRPLCSSSRLINIYASTVASGNNVNLYDNGNNSTQWWKFQSVSGGFAIRNVQNSDVCLNVKDGWDVNVLNYTGSNNQKWQIQNSVQYNANGGSDAPEYQLKNYGEPLTLSNNIPTRSGYAFAGWSEDADAVTADYQPGESYTANRNATLYAVWAQPYYTVTYNANGGTGAPSSQTKEYGKRLSLSSVIPTRSGYTFAGWGLKKQRNNC